MLPLQVGSLRLLTGCRPLAGSPFVWAVVLVSVSGGPRHSQVSAENSRVERRRQEVGGQKRSAVRRTQRTGKAHTHTKQRF